LRQLGFEVIEKHDLTLPQLTQELKAFGDKASEYDWAMVYYAGHGIEVGGVNYLIPVDAELTNSTHVDDEAMPLDRVLAKVEGAKKLRPRHSRCLPRESLRRQDGERGHHPLDRPRSRSHRA
jgi:uncharacterized caspase-like protein